MGQQQERRQHRRIPFTGDILINDEILVKGVDISEGGLYVHTGRSFKVGSIIQLKLSLNDEEVQLKAVIQHDQPAIGMGLMFIDLTDEQLGRIRQYISEKTKKKSHVKKGKKKVLLVEDDETSRRMSKSKLTLEGYQVIDVKDGIEAIKYLNEEEAPDLIILDLCMEKLDGFKVLTIIRESPQWQDIPVIVFSAKGTQDVIDKVINAGADEFLVKMMTSPAKLFDTAKHVLDRYDE